MTALGSLDAEGWRCGTKGCWPAVFLTVTQLAMHWMVRHGARYRVALRELCGGARW